jgi:hypothetical protein
MLLYKGRKFVKIGWISEAAVAAHYGFCVNLTKSGCAGRFIPLSFLVA